MKHLQTPLIPLAGLIWFALVLFASCCSAQSATPTEAPAVTEAEKRFREAAQEVASAYELRRDANNSPKLEKVAEPVLRWANPLGGQQAHGEIFLWTNGGLPVAVLSINEFTRPNGMVDGEHEWCALTNEPIFATGPHRWSPEKTELSYRMLPTEEPIADSPVRRLRQMRALANRFSGTKTTRTGESRVLRLLPQPIYRYDSKNADVIDGGLFAMVEATDPEALLLLEARRTAASDAWQFAFARLNSVKLTASLDDQQVWEAPQLAGRDVYDRADKPYTAFLIN